MRKFIRRIYDKLTLRDKISILNVMIILTTLLVLGYFSSDISSEIITEKTEKSAVRELELIQGTMWSSITAALMRRSKTMQAFSRNIGICFPM
ncbi:hypothetical protein SAMN05216378_3799 [Paenibacillus catalpae]|uniref:Uncharacterized protein n=1 Tax=Paenibacillus catalpae TaxID=1045775 RepID=A0A1I2C5B7_9BACL|nr:hypothetical protein SAMN05216378_3799 [Paenibacillus catalpae]